MRLILASRSPRRIEMLNARGAETVILPADIDEDAFAAESPAELVRLLASEKARASAALYQGEEQIPIVAADTVVDLDGKVLGKPRDREEARQMLRALSGREHFVHTGVAVMLGDRLLARTESTAVCFREVTDEEIESYLDTSESMDKAGAYAIQGKAAIFVRAIYGDYHSVVGLPLCLLHTLLKELGTEGL